MDRSLTPSYPSARQNPQTLAPGGLYVLHGKNCAERNRIAKFVANLAKESKTSQLVPAQGCVDIDWQG